MSRFRILLLFAAGTMLLASSLVAMAQQDRTSAPAARQAGDEEAPAMDKPMKLKCQMMMKMEVQPTDPAALLSVAEQLGLNEQQQEKLEQILRNARQQAEELLTSAQQEELEGLEKLPSSHMAMHMKMMQSMKGGRGRGAGGMCPMMRAMPEEMQKMRQKMRVQARS